MLIFFNYKVHIKSSLFVSSSRESMYFLNFTQYPRYMILRSILQLKKRQSSTSNIDLKIVGSVYTETKTSLKKVLKVLSDIINTRR